MVELEEPDKGYAWVVLFCACIINMILSGMGRMIGLLYVGLIDAFGITREQASLPFSVRIGVRYLAGPLAGVLGQTYGIRTVSFWGGVIAAGGSILSSLAPNITSLVVFWGLLHGTGYAFANTLFQVVINQYFEKHRASASGIVLSGACVGAFIFPIMIERTISEYGIFGCFLLLGGLYLHVLPPSLLLKTPPWIEFPEAYARKREQLLKLQMNEENNKKKLFIAADHQVLSDVYPENNPLSKCKTGSVQSEGLCFQSEKNCKQSDVVGILYLTLDADEILRRNEIANFQNGIANPAFVQDCEKSNCPSKEQKVAAAERTTPRKHNSFLENLLMIPTLCQNPVYCLINLSLAAYFAVLLPVFTVINDYTRDKGIPRDRENFLVYSLTVGDLVGRLAFGWVTDRKYMSLPNFMMLVFFLEGVFTALLPASSSLAVYAFALGLYGISAGIIFTYIPVLVHKYVDVDNQSIAMGCVGLLSSVTTFLIPTLIGYFRDNVGSYDGLFYTVASFSVVIAGLWLLVSICHSIQERRQESRPT